MIGRGLRMLCFFLTGAVAVAAVPLDVFFPEGGEPVVGRVKEVETLFLVINTEGASEPVRIALGDLKWVDFGEARLMENFLRQSASSPIPELQRFWEERRTLLEVPGSTGGVIGLRLAQRLQSTGSLEAASNALEVADLIAQKDWSEETRAEAQVMKVGALLALNRGLEASAELEKLPAKILSERCRGMVALLRGDLELQQARRQAAYEQYLRPYVFGGAATELPAVGLERARKVADRLPKPEFRRRQIDEQLSALRGETKEME